MIQLNLLPDVKLEYLRAERSRRLVLSSAILVAAAAIAILVLLLGVDYVQKAQINSLSHKINSASNTLKNKPNISKILTVQNQLESLTALHAGKPAAQRLFSNYLDQVTPAAADIADLHIDFKQQTVTITGSADALSTVNKYVDTLKFTNYTTDSNTTPTKAFNNVVLTSFSLNSGSKDSSQAASYEISLSYDPAIFDVTKNVKLSVPSITTTRSQLDQPGDLFKAAPTTTKAQGAQ